MRKNIFKSLALGLILATAGMLSSCDHAIDVVQPGEINESVIFTSVDNLERFLIGDVYNNINPGNEFHLTSVLTDELKPGAGSGGQDFQLHRFFVQTNDTRVRSIWTSYYLVINRVNRLLQGAELITPTTQERERYDRILAEARALRAFAYTTLSAYYTVDMKDVNAPGVILVKDVPSSGTVLPRATNGAVFSFIEEDIDYAKGILKQGTGRFRVNINFVNALAARYYLYRGDYAKSKQYATQVISSSGLSLSQAGTFTQEEVGTDQWNQSFYGVASSTSDYRKIWIDVLGGEIISAFERIGTGTPGNIGSFWNTNASNITGSPFWAWGRNLFNIWDTTAGDIRRFAYVDPSSRIDPLYAQAVTPQFSDQLIIDKYPGKTNFPLKNDIKVFRLSEMHLILAEIAVFENDFATAQAHVQQVREARNYLGIAETPLYANQVEALQDIMKERRVELALEGHRYIDLKRLAAQAQVKMDRNPTDDIVPVSNLENGDYRYTLPIPIAEVTVNPTIEQNPGY